tara:strand:+ start:3505 stop:4095 length:591 start_codon:yes stop_codon:yes gene_type:complete
MNDEYNKILKCIFIGDAYVGKTSLCKKLCQNNFPLSYMSTIGVDFFIKIISINDENIKLQMWDTTGQEKYNSITTSFYRNAKFIFLMFDLTNYKSFYNIKNWLKEIDYYCDDNIKKVLIGNKSDLKSTINENEINDFCYNYDILYYSCSVKNDNIEDLMKTILNDNLQLNNFKNMTIDDNIIKITNKKNKKCCIIL